MLQPAIPAPPRDGSLNRRGHSEISASPVLEDLSQGHTGSHGTVRKSGPAGSGRRERGGEGSSSPAPMCSAAAAGKSSASESSSF